MIKQIENYLNCRQHLRDNIPMITEYFVKYYGEEKRKEIEDKFAHALFLAYRRPQTTETFLNNISDEISDEIEDRYIKESQTVLTKEDLFAHSFQYQSIQPLETLKEFIELYQMGREGRLRKFKQNSMENMTRFLPSITMEEYEEMIQTQTILTKYQEINPYIKKTISYCINLENAESEIVRSFKGCESLLHKIDPAITIENYGSFRDNEQIKILEQLARQRSAMIQEYEERMRVYDGYKKESDESKERLNELKTQFFIRFIEENIDLLSPEDLESFKEYKENPQMSQLNRRLYTIFGYSLSSLHNIDNFGEDAEEILRSNTPSWKVDSIKKGRINYFIGLGVDVGDEYESYTISEEAKKIWPTTERVSKFQESRDRLLNEFNIEYYSSIPDHKAAREEIKALHFLDKEDSFNASLYASDNPYTFVNPNLVRTEDGYRLYPIVAVNCNRNTGNTDHDIIHELNHLYELSLKDVDDKHYDALCGWDVLEAELNQESSAMINTLSRDRTKRSYELFNEIINELIAQEISGMMLQDKSFVFDSEENVTIKNTTSYEHTFFIVRDFFREFKEDIIKSRNNGNIQIIWDRVGKENFDALNDLFRIYYENFDGFRIYSVLQALAKNEDTPQTKKYHEIQERRDEIMDKMRKYSMLHESEENLQLPQQEVQL